jgi:hypothetical protein
MGIHPFFIDTARLESTTSVKKSNELWRPVPHASCRCAPAPTTSIETSLHTSSFAL